MSESNFAVVINNDPDQARPNHRKSSSGTMPEMAHVSVIKARRYMKSQSMESNDGRMVKRDSVVSDHYGAITEKDNVEREVVKQKSWLSLYWDLISSKYINIMLLFAPFAYLSVVFDWGDTSVFVLNFLAMLPLAALLGDLTEAVADDLGQTAGGLISASFGNAPELVFAIQALRANQIRVVQASLLGSILSNLLLVLGSSFFAGGLFSGKKEQQYNRTSAIANTSLLMMSTLALFLPGQIANYYEAYNLDVLMISRFTAIGMLLMYLQLMIFQFKTHKDVFTEEENEDEQEEEVNMELAPALVGLGIVTALVAIFSDYLVNSINGFSEATDLSTTFVGIILIPIIGNVVEHIVAVTVAVKDKMELSMGIAVGSACQVSLFVIPTAVLAGWVMDRDLTLNFPQFEVYVYLVSILLVSHLVGNGNSNWLLGSLLITCYFLLAFAFWFEQVTTYSTSP
eukprot:CAMPEP_0171461834 /NCGR_PEP_ID=MMETSP0945-20130129/6120_1 /TAXON_ID=109269 /ORGANISM="Vaucheria litorea, Strain CCMP2940" /LENGTH=455 /DNA_ID=CAMNT_0011988253 /DNA_START=39 /DNA_END=1406 /DNA_ORIENTATION=-